MFSLLYIFLYAPAAYWYAKGNKPLRIPTGVTTAHPDGKSYNNPGNIRDSATAYDGEEIPSNGFANFKHIVYGYRAMYMLLLNYFQSKQLTTIRQIISVYAPSSDMNDVKAYVDFITNSGTLNPDYVYSLMEFKMLLPTIVRRMIQYEQGWKLSDTPETLQDIFLLTAANLAMPEMNFQI